MPLRGVTIGIDPGHQGRGNPEKEPQAPGSSIMKAKVTSGATGSFSKVQEHTVNLAVGLALKQKLEEAGARVVMTRRSADVDISNAQRAQLFNEQAVDLGIRLHCNAADSESAQGALMLLPQQNPYQSLCERAGSSILQAYVAATGFPSEGIRRLGDQTGFNWCARPIVNLEMGYLTNRSEDLKLSDPAFQQTMAEGIYRGVLNYFAKAGSRLEG